ncbi:unnamed protein product [Brassicogethes aeneus]|uniref:Cytochrome b5 domain-containing protein 1 n=1 Tax=Brassicogethes aeneus TaxID=1431903 RepID=A0A9P0FGH3_BRAAE|nr:unnamed protein product [Brassicogethes aeneus]
MKDLEPNKWRYYGPFEVVVHNSPRDCWVSFLGKVYNITPLITIYSRDPCIKPLLAMAGKDISHWFDEKAGDIQHYIHPVTGNFVPYLPYGKIPDIEPQVPDTRWRPEHNPWWKNDLYQIGLLTKRARPLRIINMLTCKEVQINVCCEDTLIRIAERYSIFNKDTDSYLWRYDGKVVNMYKTLEENGILDERDRFCELGIPANFYIPAILLYFTDDFNHLEDDLDDEDECEIFQKSITVDLTPKEISAPDYLSTIDMEVAEEGYKDDDNDLLYFRQAIMDLPPIHTNVIRELLQSTTINNRKYQQK